MLEPIKKEINSKNPKATDNGESRSNSALLNTFKYGRNEEWEKSIDNGGETIEELVDYNDNVKTLVEENNNNKIDDYYNIGALNNLNFTKAKISNNNQVNEPNDNAINNDLNDEYKIKLKAELHNDKSIADILNKSNRVYTPPFSKINENSNILIADN